MFVLFASHDTYVFINIVILMVRRSMGDGSGVDGVGYGSGVHDGGGVVSVDGLVGDGSGVVSVGLIGGGSVDHGGVVDGSLVVDGLVVADDVLGGHGWGVVDFRGVVNLRGVVQETRLARRHQRAGYEDLRKYINFKLHYHF